MENISLNEDCIVDINHFYAKIDLIRLEYQWSGDARSPQGIGSYGIDLVVLEYSLLSTRKQRKKVLWL